LIRSKAEFGELQSTHLTILLVNVRVTLQRKLIAKRAGTNVAFVGFNTEVNLFVVLEMSCLGEGRVTPLALVGFLAGSSTNETSESRRGRRRLTRCVFSDDSTVSRVVRILCRRSGRRRVFHWKFNRS
jgi:hypothetical protein